MQHCSLQHQTLLSPPDTSTTEHHFCFGPASSFFLELSVFFPQYEEYVMQNAGLDDSQAGIKIARRNINNLRYEDYTTLMAKNKEN